MRDLGLVVFLLALIGLGFKRPFLLVCAYVYIDIVSPQRLSYFLLNSIPISQIVFGLAVVAWLAADDKRDTRFGARQGLMLMLLGYCALTTFQADFPDDAWSKWEWVWPSLVFAVFLPLVLRTRLRVETVLLFMILAASAIIIGAGIKTVLGGSGYGSFAMMVDNNSGLYEDSTIATVAIAIIPIILWFTRHGTIFAPDWRVKWFAWALCFACLLMPIGTQARTGLVAAAVLALLMLRDSNRKALYVGAVGVAGMLALPFIPSAFSERMETITTYQADSSATTRLAVWAWTWDYAKQHPWGGGFDAYRANRIQVRTEEVQGSGMTQQITEQTMADESRAYHSAYFEMLGEQGWPGLILWLLIHAGGVWRMEALRRRYAAKRAAEGEQWIAPLATALENAHIVYMVGSLFVGIAFQPFVYMIVGVEIGLDTYLARRRKEAAWRPLRERAAAA
ncbi:MAG: putative O-glycosylation ligase, exosortase A system-associated [Sphingomonadaceae bacterium]|nr:putative O-glycosylation ligase, exosortase A system-associated [Sphingomonadaceae bacterium]